MGRYGPGYRASTGRRLSVLETQGLTAVAFFEATAFIILMVLFVLLRRDHPSRYLNLWAAAWGLLTLKALLELAQLGFAGPALRVGSIILLIVVHLAFLKAV